MDTDILYTKKDDILKDIAEDVETSFDTLNIVEQTTTEREKTRTLSL